MKNQKRLGTLNCQGLLNPIKLKTLVNDIAKYNLHFLTVQETHMKGSGMIELKSPTNETIHFFYSGHKDKSINGVGVLVNSKYKAEFKPISDRMCMLTIKLDPSQRHRLCVISTYAPTQRSTEKDPNVTLDFYDELNATMKQTKPGDTLLIGGDFNAKTKISDEHVKRIYKDTVGNYSVSSTNTNGTHLLEFAKSHHMKITNTFFKHKPSHLTTWECPQRIQQHMDSATNTIRRNPYRNQIDYVLARKSPNITICNSRSYNGIQTKSDHKMVIATFRIKLRYDKLHKRKSKTINMHKLNDPAVANLYKTNLEQKFNNRERNITSNQSRWIEIVAAIKETTEETIGYVTKHHHENNPEIKKLSELQKKKHLDMNSINNKEQRLQIKQERNRILNEIHAHIKSAENEKIRNALQELENSPNDSQKMFQAVKYLQKISPKAPLLLQSTNGLTANEAEQANLIANHFNKQFNKNAEPLPKLESCKMRIPFSIDEIRKAVKRIKNNKSPGADGITAELLKHAPDTILKEIAKLYNIMAETGDTPREIIQGVLCALQKPGKPKGPLQNLRPIVLLSIIRKILAICLMNRIQNKLDNEIPPSQAAYRKLRSTTEHVFATKMIIDRTITAKEETSYLLLHDMSKAFDSINRKTLINDLKTVIQPDELHLVNQMIQVELAARVGNHISEYFKTDTGAPQGDCLSANEFTFYLAKTLSEENGNDEAPPPNGLHINMEYADDITEICDDYSRIESIKRDLPGKLHNRNLHINVDKTEEYTVNKNTNEWRKCKLLGSILDTDGDIKRRKGLAINALNKIKYILNNNKLTLKTKSQAFNTYVGSIFLYNSELWTMTKKRENKIDVFQRTLLRSQIIQMKWPDVISNELLYQRTSQKVWSEVIRKRRLRWFGHMARLPNDTPAKIALDYATEPYEKSRGRPVSTWLSQFKKELSEREMTWDNALIAAQDETTWENIINNFNKIK